MTFGGCSAKQPAEIPNIRPVNFQAKPDGTQPTAVTKQAFER